MNALKETWGWIQIHPELNARDARFKICDHIKQTQTEWKGEEISAKNMGKCLHIFFKAVINDLNSVLPSFR